MRTQKAFYTIVSSFALQFCTVILNVITLKFFLETYGSEINGLNASIMQSIGYLNLVEAGIGMASIQALYKPLAVRNYDGINGILSATRKFYIQSGLFFTALIAILAAIFPLIVKGSVPALTCSLLVIILGGGSMLEYFLHGKYRVLLTADQKGYLINGVQTAALTVGALLRIVLMKSGFNILIVQSVYTIICILRVVILSVYISKKYPGINYREEPDTKAVSKRWSVLAHQIAGLMVFNSSVIILTIFCGLREASVFAVYNLVFGTLVNFIWLFADSVTPGFGELIAKDDKKLISEVSRSYQSVFYMMVTWVYIEAYTMIIPFVKLYTAKVYDVNYVDHNLALLFTLVGISNCIRVPANTLITAAGHFPETKYRAIAEAAINITASLVFVRFLGIYGVLLGALCSFIYRTTDTVLYGNHRILNQSVMGTVGCVFRNLIPGIILSVLYMRLAGVYIQGWLSFAAWGVITSIVTLIVVTAVNAAVEPAVVKELLHRLIVIFKRGRSYEVQL